MREQEVVIEEFGTIVEDNSNYEDNSANESSSTDIQEVAVETMETIQDTQELVEVDIFAHPVEDMSDYNIGSLEAEYRNSKEDEVVREKVNEAVHEVVRRQNDRLKLEMTEVLDSEVNRRLSKYDKRRRRRQIFDAIKGVFKVAIVIGVLSVVIGNQQIRTKMITLYTDAKNIVIGIINDEEVSSNELVENLFDVEEASYED